MTQYWEPGTQYNYNDVVEYEGHRYKIIQPHRSQGDWAPDVTPALWGRLQDGDHSHGHGHQQPAQQRPECDDKPQQHQQQHNQQPMGQAPPKYGSGHGSDSDDEGKAKKDNWFDDNKGKLGFGAAILGGAAAIGAGVIAYKKHEEHKEEAASEAWASENWVADARARAEKFNQYGPQAPYTWYLNHGKNIPNGALLVGTEKNWNLYVCRALYEGALVLGKASDVFNKGGVLGTQGMEVHTDTYEILLADPSHVQWVSWSGRFSIASLGARPIEGGREADGTKIYVIQAFHKGAVHPGKIGEGWDKGYIPYDGKEKDVSEYKVLCLKD